MKPNRIEFNVGQTKHNQPIRLIGEKTSGEEYVWSLHKEAVNQRDEDEIIRNIPASVFVAINAAIKESQ